MCPNEGFSQQLRKFEASPLRAQLAQEMRRQCADYEALRQRDLSEVAAALRADAGRQVAPREVEHNAQKNALGVLRNAVATQSGARLRLGTGEGRGDVGLSWLVRDDSRTGIGSSSTEAERSQRVAEQNCVDSESTGHSASGAVDSSSSAKFGAARRMFGRLGLW